MNYDRAQRLAEVEAAQDAAALRLRFRTVQAEPVQPFAIVAAVPSLSPERCAQIDAELREQAAADRFARDLNAE